MLPAEGTDGIDDPIHLPEGHTVHSLVQILKGSLDCIGGSIIALMVIGIKHLYDGMRIVAVVRRILCRMAFQYFNVLIHPLFRHS